MLFKCLPPGAELPGRFPGPAHARGKWFTIDIHCHVTSLKAAAFGGPLRGSGPCSGSSSGTRSSWIECSHAGAFRECRSCARGR